LSEHFAFKVLQTSGCQARLGRITTPRGIVETPAFMPVATQGTVKAITRRQLLDLGAEIILANAYHLYIRPGMEIIRKAGGLHDFMGWEKPMLTDSGGYQVFSLSALREVTEEGATFRSPVDGAEHFLTPEGAVEIQHGLGAEIIMAFDEPVSYGTSRGKAEAAAARSDRWAGRCNVRHDSLGGRALFGIVQGGFWEDLREESARRIVEMDFEGYAIGGLSVGEPKELTFSLAEHTLKFLPADSPRYLMGVGLPHEILRAVRLGVDMFDCVLPTRLGRNGTALTRYGKMNLRNHKYQEDFRPLDVDCQCFTCKHHSRAYLRHLHKAKEILAATLICYHNLHIYLDLMRETRAALAQNRFEEFYREFEAKRESLQSGLSAGCD
jgi:queuine tRNA-ribosyltransferase